MPADLHVVVRRNGIEVAHVVTGPDGSVVLQSTRLGDDGDYDVETWYDVYDSSIKEGRA